MLMMLGASSLCVGILLLPDVEPLVSQNPTETSYMRRPSRSGKPGPSKLEVWTPLRDISPMLACAVIKAEDHDFFNHRGFDWAQLRRAMSRNLLGPGAMGGSTLTQQLARNLFLGPERTWRRKASEAWLTLRLEQRLSKERLLELYLNVIEWGEGVWGITAASHHYFGEPPGDLDAFESTFLAALIAAPTHSLTGKNLERAARSQRRTLAMLRASGLLPPEIWRDASSRATALKEALDRGVPLALALREARAALARPQVPSPPLLDSRQLGAALSVRCELSPSALLP